MPQMPGKAAVGPEGRPVSFADALEGIVRWMDRTDRILVKRGEKKGLSDGVVQRDLLRAARALREDPTLDALMVDAMLHGPDEDETEPRELF